MVIFDKYSEKGIQRWVSCEIEEYQSDESWCTRFIAKDLASEDILRNVAMYFSQFQIKVKLAVLLSILSLHKSSLSDKASSYLQSVNIKKYCIYIYIYYMYSMCA